MVTRIGAATLLAAVALGAAGRVFAILEFYVFAAALFMAIAAAIVWVWLNRFATRTQRNVTPLRLHAHKPVAISVQVHNRYPFAPPIEVIDSVEGEVQTRTNVANLGTAAENVTYKLFLTRRGHTTIGPLKVKTADPFGFATTTHRGAPDTRVLVLPHIHTITAPPKPSGVDMTRLELIASRQSPTGEEFSTLRNYVIGDDLRKVNWKASSRSEDLIMRVDEVSEEGETLITLDLRSGASSKETFESMVSATASLISAASQRHDRIRLLSTHDHDLEIRDAHGYDQAMNFLALVKQKSAKSVKLPDRLRKRALRRSDVGVFICGEHPESALGELWQRTSREVGTSVITCFSHTTPNTQTSAAITVLQVEPSTAQRSDKEPPAQKFAQIWQNTFAKRVTT